MEARLAAITASINESRRLLASCARQLGVQEQERQAATSLFAVATTSLSMPSRVLEQPAVKPPLPSLFSAVQVVGVGGLHTEAIFAPSMPTRCSTVGSTVDVGSNHVAVASPTSGTAHLLATTSTDARHSTLQGSTAGAHAVHTEPLRCTSFPCFDGTNPRLWRTQCLDYFTRFSIPKCMWVLAASMHMVGKAKEWYKAYKLRQAVGNWSEFMDTVEAKFGAGDFQQELQVEMLPFERPVLPAAHLVFDGAPNSSVSDDPGARALDVDSYLSAEVLTHVGGLSLFEKLDLDSAHEVSSDIGDSLWGDEFADCVVTHIGDSSLFLEKVTDIHHELDGEIDKSTCLDHGVGGVQVVSIVVPSAESKLQQLLSRKMNPSTNMTTIFLPWDPGVLIVVAEIPELSTTRTSEMRRSSQNLGMLPEDIFSVKLNEQIWLQITHLATGNWDPGIKIIFLLLGTPIMVSIPCLIQVMHQSWTCLVPLEVAILVNLPQLELSFTQTVDGDYHAPTESLDGNTLVRGELCGVGMLQGLVGITLGARSFFCSQDRQIYLVPSAQGYCLKYDDTSVANEFVHLVEFLIGSMGKLNYICHWCSLQFFARELQYLLRLSGLWHCHDNKHARYDKRNLGGIILYEGPELIQLPHMQQESGNHCSHIFGDVTLGLISNIDLVLVCTSLWPTEVKMVSYDIAADYLFLFLCQLLNEALKAGHVYEMEAPLETLVAVTLPSTSQSKRFATTSDFLMWSSKHVLMPWDPGDVHNTTFSPRAQSIVWVCLERPWDPGIIVIHKMTVSDDLNAEVGATKCCNLIEPLLGGKQRFLGAVMSHPSMWLLWAYQSWAVAHVDLDLCFYWRR